MTLARLIVLVAPAWFLLAAPSTTAAQELTTGAYSLDRAGSAVGFTISASMIFKVKRQGSFKDFSGDLSYDPANPGNTHMDLTVYTGSVDMRNAEHDELLKSPAFFDVEHFPTMHFVGTAATAARPDGTFSLSGEMTIRGVTRPMTIPVRMRPNPAAGGLSSPVFESNFQIDRTEFGLNGLPKGGGFKVSISKKVDIHIAIATSVHAPQ